MGELVPGTASFNAFTPAFADSAGGALSLPAGASAQLTVTPNVAEWALTPPLGLMTVVVENNSARQAHLNPMHVTTKSPPGRGHRYRRSAVPPAW